jgi:hydroxyquinol 1,2-dioxygenase
MSVREFNEQTLTAEVLKRISGAPDKRLARVMRSFVTHLHAFVREIRPTPHEWGQAIRFLTETGRISDHKRQEFILLSDTLGVSMLVDYIAHGKAGNATESTVLGPFFVEGAPQMPMGANIARLETPGEPCSVTGTVKDLEGKPVSEATMDVWEAEGDGLYDVQKSDGANARGRFRLGADGRFHFRCILPTSYPVPHDGPVGKLLAATGRHPMRPAHLHFKIAAPGFETLVTHLFVKGGEFLDSDAVFGVKRSLIVDFTKNEAEEYDCRYDFVLKPSRKRSVRKRRR